jgi:hypothetical protein
MILPHDVDFILAASFILILIDIIGPSPSEPWDPNAVLSLLDNYVAQGIIIAGPQKKDLLEIIHLRKTLGDRQPKARAQAHDISGNQLDGSDIGHAASNLFPPKEDMQPNHGPHIGPVRAEWHRDSGLVHPETIQSAIEGLDLGFLDDRSVAETVGNDWMWRARWASSKLEGCRYVSQLRVVRRGFWNNPGGSKSGRHPMTWTRQPEARPQTDSVRLLRNDRVGMPRQESRHFGKASVPLVDP